MKKPLLCQFLLLPIFLPAAAEAAYVYTGTTITENFDSLPTTTIAGVFAAAIGTQSAISGTGFVGTKAAGTGTSATALTVDNGSLNSGAIYSYGATSNGERALGMVASGTNIMAVGFELVNSSLLSISEITISLTAEFWRSSTTTQNSLTVGTATSNTVGVTGLNFLTASGFSATTALVGPSPVITNGLLDGNLLGNQSSYSTTITGLNIAPGGSFYIRWVDTNEAGNDAGLAIDNLTVAVTTVPEPSMALLGSLCFLGLLRRRR